MAARIGRPGRHAARLAATERARNGDSPGASSSTVDLHTHTLRSDGVLEPVELVRAAAAAGIRTLAITDHDTLAAYRDLVLGRAMPAAVDLIPGVEINALARGIPLAEGELHAASASSGRSRSCARSRCRSMPSSPTWT
jgi:DNA polymerase III alpha subunit (gram-positive type)